MFYYRNGQLVRQPIQSGCAGGGEQLSRTFARPRDARRK